MRQGMCFTYLCAESAEGADLELLEQLEEFYRTVAALWGMWVAQVWVYDVMYRL